MSKKTPVPTLKLFDLIEEKPPLGTLVVEHGKKLSILHPESLSEENSIKYQYALLDLLSASEGSLDNELIDAKEFMARDDIKDLSEEEQQERLSEARKEVLESMDAKEVARRNVGQLKASLDTVGPMRRMLEALMQLPDAYLKKYPPNVVGQIYTELKLFELLFSKDEDAEETEEAPKDQDPAGSPEKV